MTDFITYFNGLLCQTGELYIAYLGQAGFLIKNAKGRTFVIDPYITNCGQRIRGFKRLSAIILQPGELRPDYYVITHTHFDHYDYDAIPEIAKESPETLFFGPKSVMEQLRCDGICERRCICLDRGTSYQGRSITGDREIDIYAVTADHARMAPDAIGVVAGIDGHYLYFSGDTAFHREIFEKASDFSLDVAFMSVNGMFGNMTPLEGAEAALICRAKAAVPCHCYTFAEHRGDPVDMFNKLADSAVKPVYMRQGEVMLLTKNGELKEIQS